MKRWRKTRSRHHVALLIESSRSYAREILIGIAKYVHIHGSWSVEFQEGTPIKSIPEWFASRKWNGIIAEVNNNVIAKAISRCGAPVVDINGDVPNLDFPVVRSDDTLIGGMAAEHLIDRGFRQFAFCGITGASWSDLRRIGFERRVREAGFAVRSFETSHLSGKISKSENDRHGERFEKNLRSWLRSLPKPLGLMACNDARASQVLACCRDLKMRVPDELAVIGVDNDEIFCELSKVPLSSVIIGTRQIGYEAASLLDQLMAGKSLSERVLLLKPMAVAERRSTDALAIEDPLLVRVIKLIREHACDGLDVNSLLKEVPVSRRVLERQFARILGRAPKEEILRVRLKRVSQLLTESNLKLAAVANKAGFKNPEHMCRLFKKRYGMTPGEFRNRTTLS